MKYFLSLCFTFVTLFSYAQETKRNESRELDLKDKLSITISTLAFGMSSVAFFFSRYQDWKSAQGAVVKALQGEKEAVAYVAYKVRSNRWNTRFKRKKFRQDVITALCLAWSFEGADRAKAIIFDTLKEIKGQGFSDDIQTVLQNMHRQFTEYRETFQPSKFDERISDVESLMENLQIKIFKPKLRITGA